jgi:hypothetical protein
MTPLGPSVPKPLPLLLEDVPWRRKGADPSRVWLREPLSSRVKRIGPIMPAREPVILSGFGEHLCCVCGHRRGTGFWFVHKTKSPGRHEGAASTCFEPGSVLEQEFHRLDYESGWRGYDSEWFKIPRCHGGLFVCFDCALYESEITYGSPQEAWSADINEIDGEEPRLSRILRQYSGLEKRPSA